MAKQVLEPENTPPAPAVASPEREAEPMEILAETSSVSVPPPHRIPRWLVRLELFLRVMLKIYVGIAVCYAPWWHAFWDRNPVFEYFPSLYIYASNGAVRGIVSGLGLLNLWFAVQDALRYRER